MPEQETYRWVAGATSADDAARSMARAGMRRRRTWVALGILFLACGAYLSTALDDVDSTGFRLLWGYGVVAAIWLVVLPLALRIGRRFTRRRFSRRIGSGVELTSRFGPSTLELAGPMSRHEISYDDFEHVERVGEWVHLRQTASPVLLIWPAALFPEHELARIQRLVDDRRSRPVS